MAVIRCSEDDVNTDTGLRAPTATEFMSAWRVIRASIVRSEGGTGSHVDTNQSSILDITASEIRSYGLDEDLVTPCYCPDTNEYALSGSFVTGENFERDTVDDGVRSILSTSWAIVANQLVITVRFTMTGNDTDRALTGPGTQSMTMVTYYDAYTGSLPTNLCSPGCSVGLFKSRQSGGAGEATNISGVWVLDRASYTTQYSQTYSGSLPDTTWVFDVSEDSIDEYEYDTAYDSSCYMMTQSDYVLSGNQLRGDNYYFLMQTTNASQSLTTTLGFNSSNELVVEGRYEVEGTETEGENTETYSAGEEQTLTMVPYDGRVPPGSWPQQQCLAMPYKARAASPAPETSVLRERFENLPVVRILGGK
jgi:hypothetical protein